MSSEVVAITGAIKLLVPREQLEKKMHWAASWPRALIKLLGLAEVAGAVRTHQHLRELAVPPLVIGLLCVAVAAGRLFA